MIEKNTNSLTKFGISLYGIAFLVFAFLLALRENTEYVHIYDFLPVMGRAIPYLTLTILLTIAYKLNGHQLKDIGCRLPGWRLSPFKILGLIVGVAILIVLARLMLAIPMSFLFNYLNIPAWQSGQTTLLAGNLTLLILILPVMLLAVIGEELLIRGFLMNMIARMFGKTRRAWVYAIIGSAIIFGIGHFPQGPRGMISAALGGLIYGTAFYLVGKSLVPVILGHAIINTVGFIAAYSEV